MLTWHWSKKVGTVEVTYPHPSGEKHYVSNLYIGNAYLIEIWESQEDTTYQLTGFWADDKHMKNCFNDSIYIDESRIYTFYIESLDSLPKTLIKNLLKFSTGFKQFELHVVRKEKDNDTEN